MTVFDESTESDNPFMTGESDDEAVYDEASAFDDSEGRHRRRLTPAQQRRLEARRREELKRRQARGRAPARMAPMAPPAPPPSPPQVAAEVRRTQAAVQDVELETRVQGDAVRGALMAERKRDSSQDLALGLTILSTQIINAFGKADGPLENPVLQAALTAAPVLVLKQDKKPLWADTRAQVIAGTATIVVAKHFFDQSKEISVVEFVSPPTTLPRAQSQFFVKAIAKNKRGNTISDVEPTLQAVSGCQGPDPITGLFTVLTPSIPVTVVILKATAKDKTAAAKEVTAQLVIPIV
jgi:hypothetical protein